MTGLQCSSNSFRKRLRSGAPARPAALDRPFIDRPCTTRTDQDQLHHTKGEPT